MFSLAGVDFEGSVLDCPGGGSSFTARARDLGATVVAADPVYSVPAFDLAELVTREAERGSLHTAAATHRYRWEFFGDIAGHRRIRQESAAVFGRDIVQSPECYVSASLPQLPFDDNRFDLVLSSHFLFMYADRLDFDFHLQSMLELTRVCRGEVRVFPLIDQAGRRLHELLRGIRDELESREMVTEVVRVEYEFQRGGNQMLVVRPPVACGAVSITA